MRLTAFATAVGAAVLLGGATARADGLSAGEKEKVLHGETVARGREVRLGSRRYVGGIAYTIVDTSAEDLEALLTDVGHWRRFLPKTRDARLVGAMDGDSLVRVTHGSTLISVAYTLRVHREGDTVRFWMDPSRAHDIEDAWGFFRAAPMPDGRTLVTYGILIDMGDGLLRDLFEPRVRELALEVPDHVRSIVLEQSARGRRAAR